MAFDQTIRNRLARFVADTRALLTEEFTRQLQNEYGLDPVSGDATPLEKLTNLDDAHRETASLLRETMAHYLASSDCSTPAKEKKARQDVLIRIVREQAFTVLNRLCALRMAEARGILVESLARGFQSKGFQLYQRIAGTAMGETGFAYQQFLFSIFDEFALDLSALFDRYSPQGRLFPRETTLLQVLDEINHPDIDPLWAEDETIGWIYQYFNQKIERDEMHRASRAPRNSREMAVRNQFFTPRYVVEFLTDNTLGRLWYEMTQGKTGLVDTCRYLVRRPDEVFLEPEQEAPQEDKNKQEAETQEELLKQTVYIPYRAIKDPREIRMLDPACGSMHFGLYAFDLFERIYDEAWDIEEEKGISALARSEELRPLTKEYPNKESFLRDVPRLIIECNIHGVDIDPRAVQIAGLSLWLRAQRSWLEQNVRPENRPQIRKSNVVCAEPMPGELDMLKEFTASLQPKLLGQLLKIIFEKMKLAGEAGTLLKIEEEIKDAITDARAEYEKFVLAQKDEDGHLPGLAPEREPSIFDFAGITRPEDFWKTAEKRLISAIKKYSEQVSQNSEQRRLFAADAEKGFAFVDISRKHYDAILMNPPFGSASVNSKEYIENHYESKGNVLTNFVERTLSLLQPGGLMGTITSRTPFFLGSMEDFRSQVLEKQGYVNLFVDFGDGVLEAMVETAAYICSKTPRKYPNKALFFRLVTDTDKESTLQGLVSHIVSAEYSNQVFLQTPGDFKSLPGCPYAYWISKKTIRTIGAHDVIEGNQAFIKVGLQTGKDWRYFRLLWEIPNDKIVPRLDEKPKDFSSAKKVCQHQLNDGGKWVPYSKTDVAEPWYSPITLAVDWQNNGWELKNFTDIHGNNKAYPRSESYYFLPGFSYMLRSTRLVPYIVPSGVIPTAGRSQAFPNKGEEYSVLAICASNMGSAVARFGGEMFARPTFQAGLVQNLPSCEFDEDTLRQIKNFVDAEVAKRRKKIQYFEPFQDFLIPAWLRNEDIDTNWNVSSLFNDKLEREIASATGLDESSYLELERDIREAVSMRGKTVYEDEDGDEEQEATTQLIEETPQTKAAGLLMYAIGVLMGRWDIRMAIDPSLAPKLAEPFEPLPVCPPGMLIGPDGLPATPNNIVSENWLRARPDAISLPNTPVEPARISEEAYPIRIAWNGILSNDVNHKQNISAGIHAVMENIFGREYERTESELLSILGTRSIADYFDKVAGFFTTHLNMYSKSRRAAPIYWPLSTASGAYTLWIYYHRLTSQTLYSCVNDFVEPKLKQTTEETERLRRKTNRSTAEERELEKLLDLELELTDFRDELLRIAQFWKPNLNDGVEITAAPLWKLFRHRQWSARLKETWEKLEAGEYDWSHLALSIWPDRVVRASLKDHSYAIAHDLEDRLWQEVKVTRSGRGGRITETMEWQPKKLTEPEIRAIVEEVKKR